MNNHRDLLGIIINVLFASAILVTIVLSLNRMGLYKLPQGIENLLFPSDKEQISENADDSKIYETAHYEDDKSFKTEKTSLSYENARKMLEAVENTRDFHHELSVKYAQNDNAEKIVVDCKNGLRTVYLYDRNRMSKSIHEAEDTITVQEYENSVVVNEFSYPSGNFTAGELAGVITDHNSFLDGEYELEEGEFSVIQGDFGIELEIAFTEKMDGYEQREIYRINTDYGVVTSAVCYEADVLVYEMRTNYLGSQFNK